MNNKGMKNINPAKRFDVRGKLALLFLLLCFVCNTSFAQIKIILKLDDFIAKNGTCTGSTTLDYIVTKKIKATIGAVAIKFDATALSTLAPYLNATNLSNEKLLEVWHHGYDHIAPEFIGTTYAYQKAHFDNANDSIKNCLRLQMRSFGAPFNHNDAVTNTVISENPNYKVCMFNDPAPSAGILNLTNRVNMEISTGNPDYNFFLTNYNTYKTVYTDYMVLQGHPYQWGTAELAQFSQIVDHLIAQGCVFVTPYEYYLSLNPSTAVPSTSQTISFAPLPAKTISDIDFSAGATASSGLSVLYNSSNTSVATIVNGNIHIVGAGTAIITASQAGDAIYKPADYVSQTLNVDAIDYRSAATGNWNTPSSWNSRNPDGSWSVASSVPTATNNVYIQNGHTITVNVANAYCNDLHLNTSGLLSIGANTVNVNGKIRAYTGTAVTGAAANDGTFYSGQTNSTSPGSTITTSTNGLLKFVGSSRNITKTGEWGGSGTTNFAEFALNADAIGVLATAIKFRTFTISSGTISAASTINVGSSSGNGNLVIKNGAKLISARVWTGTAGTQAITYNSLTKIGVLQIDNGGTLELTGATSAIDCTTFTNNGTVIYSGSAQTLARTGVDAGSAPLNNYTNLIISGFGTKTLSTAITVFGVLTVEDGKLTTGTNNLTLAGSASANFAGGTSLAITGGITDFAGKSVTLKSVASESNAPETAYIETITGTLNNATNVTVQQYIPGGYRTFRFLSHPFTTAQPLSQLTDNIDITGNGGSTNGFTTTVTNNASALYFNTATANGASSDGGWLPFTSALTNDWAKGQGIRVLVRGSKGQAGSLSGTTYTPDAVTLDMNGAINVGTVSTSLSAAGTGSTQGFNLVGNPYPSPVDIGAVLTAASNIGSTFYVRNPQIGSYITVNPIPASYMLPANSAFFAVATAATNLNFAEANKNACTSCATVFRNSSLHNFIQLKALKNGMEYDNLFIHLDSQYNNAYEKVNDAIKLKNDGLNIYTISTDNEKLAADYRNLSTSTIPMGIILPAAYGKQTYVLQVSDYNMQPNSKVYLHDKLTNSYTLIRKDAVYKLEVEPSNPSNIGEERLEIVLEKQLPAPTINPVTSFNVTVSASLNDFVVKYEANETANTNIKLLNSAGQTIQNISLGKQQQGQYKISSLLLTQGLYMIEVQMGNEKVTKKAVKL
jgi:hypothetical protein